MWLALPSPSMDDDASDASETSAPPSAVLTATPLTAPAFGAQEAPSVPAVLAPTPRPDAEFHASSVPERGTCPSEMVLVQGLYCPDVVHTCLRWLDDERLPFARCAEYAPRARCKGEKQALRYCIDRREFTPEGERLPLNHQSFVKVEALCAQVGKRVCTEREWNFACEGEEMLPYPYGHQRKPVCNQDRSDLYEENPSRQVLKDNRRASGSMPECQSPFGVFDMVGNLDEPVLREAQRNNYPFRNGLKGGWWMAGRNRCRPATTAHDDHYQGIQIGIRCCRDASL